MKMTRTDKKLEKLGFIKRVENKHGAAYTRANDEYSYIHCLVILRKANGDHIIQSYQRRVNSNGFNNVVGLTYKEMKLALKKYRHLKRKYRWE